VYRPTRRVLREKGGRGAEASGGIAAGRTQAGGEGETKEQTTAGRFALGFTAPAIGSRLLLPLITVRYRYSCPITDTWVMPAIGTGLVAVAAALNMWCVWRRGERSPANRLAAALLAAAVLFLALMMLGDRLGG